jgi:Flp pilus assembly protein TadG
MYTRRRRCLSGNEKGAALVELALVLTLLLVLIIGMIDFGLVLKDYLALSQVAREAARSAAVGSSMGVVTGRVATWSTNLGLNAASVSPSVAKDPNPGGMATVTLTYPHNLILGGFLGMPNTVQLRARMAMRVE